MSTEEWLLFVHILSAVIWVGGATILVMLSRDTLRRGEAGTTLARARDLKSTGPIFGITSVLVLGTGAWLVIEESEWAFDQAWILTSLVLTGIMVIIGFAYHAPGQIRTAALAEEVGGHNPKVIDRMRASHRVETIEIAAFAFIIWLMVARPWG